MGKNLKKFQKKLKHTEEKIEHKIEEIEDKIDEKIKKIPLHRKIGGVFLIGLGIIGLFLPILQGVLLITAGLAMLGVLEKYWPKWLRSKK